MLKIGVLQVLRGGTGLTTSVHRGFFVHCPIGVYLGFGISYVVVEVYQLHKQVRGS